MSGAPRFSHLLPDPGYDSGNQVVIKHRSFSLVCQSSLVNHADSSLTSTSYLRHFHSRYFSFSQIFDMSAPTNPPD